MASGWNGTTKEGIELEDLADAIAREWNQSVVEQWRPNVMSKGGGDPRTPSMYDITLIYDADPMGVRRFCLATPLWCSTRFRRMDVLRYLARRPRRGRGVVSLMARVDAYNS